jgi:hypothetical protein
MNENELAATLFICVAVVLMTVVIRLMTLFPEFAKPSLLKSHDTSYSPHTPPLTLVSLRERPLLREDPFSDYQGRCWCGNVEFEDQLRDTWPDHPYSWELREPCAQDDCPLAHLAIPVPKVKK